MRLEGVKGEHGPVPQLQEQPALLNSSPTAGGELHRSEDSLPPRQSRRLGALALSLSQNRTLAELDALCGGFQAGLESLQQLSLSQGLFGSHLGRSGFPARHCCESFLCSLQTEIDPVSGSVLVGRWLPHDELHRCSVGPALFWCFQKRLVRPTCRVPPGAATQGSSIRMSRSGSASGSARCATWGWPAAAPPAFLQ